MINTYTKIKLKIFVNLDQNMTSLQSYDAMVHTKSSAVPEQKWIHSQDKFDFTFSLDSNLGVHSPDNPDLILLPVTFGFF